MHGLSKPSAASAIFVTFIDIVVEMDSNIQGVPWQRASGIGLLQACFRASEVPKGVIVTPRVGANYI